MTREVIAKVMARSSSYPATLVSMKAAIESALGRRLSKVEPVSRGYTHNRRAVATLEDGNTVFVKAAVDDDTAGWLRREYEMYAALAGAPFIAELLAWVGDEHPILVLEDLSQHSWPPPWSRAQVDAVLETLSQIAATAPPPALPRAKDRAKYSVGWGEVLARPAPFLALGLCSAGWLERFGAELADAAAAAPLEGGSLLHNDIRSDNICFREAQTIVVDWNLVGVGNPVKDIAFWLPSLAAEGGPEPEAVAPDLDCRFAALTAGFFAARAGLPPIPRAPRVREVQLQQLRIALPWAARALGLAPPDGP